MRNTQTQNKHNPFYLSFFNLFTVAWFWLLSLFIGADQPPLFMAVLLFVVFFLEAFASMDHISRMQSREQWLFKSNMGFFGALYFPLAPRVLFNMFYLVFAFIIINPDNDNETTLVWALFFSVLKELIIFFHAFIQKSKLQHDKRFEITLKERGRNFEIFKSFIIANYSGLVFMAFFAENRLTEAFFNDFVQITLRSEEDTGGQAFLLFIIALATYWCSVFIEMRYRRLQFRKPIEQLTFWLSFLSVPASVVAYTFL